MKELISQVAEELAKKYSLDKRALLNQNPDIMYINTGNELIELEKLTHLSKVITKDVRKIRIFDAIQTLLGC